MTGRRPHRAHTELATAPSFDDETDAQMWEQRTAPCTGVPAPEALRAPRAPTPHPPPPGCDPGRVPLGATPARRNRASSFQSAEFRRAMREGRCQRQARGAGPRSPALFRWLHACAFMVGGGVKFATPPRKMSTTPRAMYTYVYVSPCSAIMHLHMFML